VTLAGAFGAALVALTAVLALLLIATAGRKALRAMGDRRRARLEARVRPALMRYLADDEPDPAGLADLTGRAAGRSLDSLAAGLLPKLRGEDRDALARVLADRGAIARARRRTRLPGAVSRARAAELLGAVRDASALPDLRRLLDHPTADVRSAAARALGKLGDTDAVPALLDAIEGPRPVPAGIVTMALLHVGPSAATPLRDGLAPDRPAIVRQVSAELLGRLGAIEALNELIAILGEDDDLEARVSAAGALGRIGHPRAAASLIAALDPEQPLAVREAAASALGALGGDDGLDALDHALRSGGHGLARAAAEALSITSPAGLARLERAAGSDATGSAEAREAMDRLALVSDPRERLAA
jgi:HEAT repeat protein